MFATDRELRQNGNINAQKRQEANTPQTEGKILDVISANSETRSGKESTKHSAMTPVQRFPPSLSSTGKARTSLG
jgi:hypothetical protein